MSGGGSAVIEFTNGTKVTIGEPDPYTAEEVTEMSACFRTGIDEGKAVTVTAAGRTLVLNAQHINQVTIDPGVRAPGADDAPPEGQIPTTNRGHG